MSEKLENYWEQVIKKIKVQTIDEQNRFRFIFTLEDGENEIAFDTLSDGEKNLFNLIVSINTAKGTKPDLIIIDEPEVYMHDDMIINMVSEISALADDLPETCIMLSTHNTALIEEVAGLDKSKVNLIVFEDKQVYNSEQDIDFINALHDNGVRFSPLMISRKPNLFIENTGDDGAKHRDFYLNFFHPRNQPNIVHIGSSGQVKEYDKVLKTIKNVVNVNKTHNNKGIIDGDRWLTKESGFKKYLLGEDALEKIVSELQSQRDFYIPHLGKSSIPKNSIIYYFNCWEIENLYLLDELLVYWTSPKGVLDKEKYIGVLKSKKEKLCESWGKTFYRSILKSVYFDDKLKNFETDLKKAETDLSKITSQSSEIGQRLSAFFDKLLEEDLLHWMPGKEVKCELKKNHYSFDSDNIDFEKLNMTRKIREIIH